MDRLRPMTIATPAVLASLLLLATAPLRTTAYPYPLQNRDSENYDAGLRFLMPRDCVQRCGSDGQYCCGSGEHCFTSAQIAGCSAAGGAYGIYTTTWTETNTFTSTVTTNWPAPEPTKAPPTGTNEECIPQKDGETPCGHICCADFQYCEAAGSCKPRDGWGGGGGGGGGVTTITSNGQTITTQYSAPYRVTSTTFSGTVGSATESVSGTGTAIPGGDGNGDEDEGTGGGLSGGAIAGIVVGVLVGIGLLMLLCFCCIARGLWALLCGGRKKEDRRRERVETVEERYRAGSRVPSAHSRRERHGGWFGGAGRPSSAATRRDEEKKSSGAKWLGIGAGAATLLALLNLRRDKKKPERKARSRYSNSYYSYTDSPSESSWDSRSRRSYLTSYIGSSSSGGRRGGGGGGTRAGSRYSRSRA